MSEGVRPSAAYWVVVVIALLWFLMGCGAYVYGHYVTPEELIPVYGEKGTEIVMGRPTWQVAGWALAVFGGLLGCIGLLLRKSWSRILFVIALLGAIVYNVWVFKSGYFQYSTGFDKFIFVMSVMAPVLMIWFVGKKSSAGIIN